MKGTSHAALGMVASTAAAKFILHAPLDEPMVLGGVLLCGIIGGLLPDIDHGSSKLGSKIPVLPHLLKHRGITHTIYFVILVFFLAQLIGLPQYLVWCLTAAVVSHIIGDMLTPMGIAPFAIGPFFNYTFRLPILKVPYLESVFLVVFQFMTYYILII
ncbi:metal-dependent hydrolase [Culicoidibacter larvae]|uniref:Metal-dependent hydrolase n=1 Tax=Culicoidibacter larvae TaxID=2579976 RepID=A0A5R8Q7J3_9FIRM|nr:metal-dependent hydrolase [Culicoidibacter larvae]TLG71075.1 metal-dependent hydrolase [Culicoidibacter larvae]